MRTAPPDNLFAGILAGTIPSHCVYQDEFTFCFLDIYPQATGHTLVIPKSYSPNLLEADSEDIAHCLATVRKLMPVIREVTGAKGVSVLTNTGRDAGQMVEYLHFHILPRNPGDSVSMSRLGASAAQSELAELADKLRQKLGQQDGLKSQ